MAKQYHTPVIIESIVDALVAGKKYHEIINSTGVSAATVAAVAKGRHRFLSDDMRIKLRGRVRRSSPAVDVVVPRHEFEQLAQRVVGLMKSLGMQEVAFSANGTVRITRMQCEEFSV